jgi:hypothetical protein
MSSGAGLPLKITKRITMNMNIIAIVAATGLASVASAEVLLVVDLSIADQITITATDGLSAVTASGSDFTGFYLDGIFGSTLSATFTQTLVSGDLTHAENSSNLSPTLYRDLSTDTGLNVYDYSDDASVSFTSGSLAFTGSATWTLDSDAYDDLLAGTVSGDIYFEADRITDLPNAQILGSYRVVPAPSALAMLGLGGLVAGRRRR